MAQGEIQTALTGGEFSPSLYARVDLAKYEIGAALIRNYFVDYRGGVSNRPGTKYIDNFTSLVSTVAPRLIPFIVSTDASYVCVFTNSLVSIYSRGVFVTSVAVPYADTDLALLKYAQSADVLTIVHPLYPPANLTRTSDVTFTYDVVTIGPKIDAPAITAMRAPHSGPYDFGYLMTAVDLDGKEESVASNIGVKKSEGMDASNNRVIGLDGTPPSQATSKFNFYKWGPVDAATMVPATQWGFIGSANIPSFSDNNIAPDFAKQPPQWGDPFSGGQIQSISVTAGGSGYVPTDWPSIPFVPLSISGDGSGAAGYAVVDVAGGKIIGAYITNPGKNYTTATVTANGEAGTGATFSLTFSPPTPVYPAAVTYIQQRRTFGGANSKPETLVMSQTGLYNNFNSTPATLDTDAITVSIASLQINTIKAFVPTSYGLLVLTTGGSFLINGGTPGASITPSSITAQAQASNGANDLPPLVINYDILYGQNKGNRIRNLAFAWQRQSYTGSDISALAIHLFDDHSTVDWCWAEEPFKLVWLVRDDGRLLSCTYVPDQEVNAWARHDTQGFFQSICAVPEGPVNAVYLIVKRYIPGPSTPPVCGGWVYYLERMDERLSDCVEDSWFLDCAARVPLTPGNDHFALSAASGDAILTFCPPASYIRGWATDYTYYNTYVAHTTMDGRDLEAHARFDFVVPSTYTPGDQLELTFSAKAVPEGGAMPGAFTAFIFFTVESVNGGVADAGPYSASGKSYAPGAAVNSWLAGTANLTSNWADYSIAVGDGSPPNGVGGVLPNTGAGESDHGWYPVLYNTGTPPTDPWTANRHFTVDIGMWFNSNDNSAVTLAGFTAIKSITWSMSGQTGTIDLSTLRSGWHLGEATVPWSAGGDPIPPGAAPFNALSMITLTQRPEAYAYQDAWLVVAPT